MPVKCIPFHWFCMLTLWAAKRNCISRVPEESVAAQPLAPEIGGGGGGGGVMDLVFGLVCGMYLWAAFAPWNLQLSMEQQLSNSFCFLDPWWILLLSPPTPATLSQIVSPLDDDVVVGVIFAKLLQHAKLVWVMTVIAGHLCWGPDPELYTKLLSSYLFVAIMLLFPSLKKSSCH